MYIALNRVLSGKGPEEPGMDEDVLQSKVTIGQRQS